MKKVLVLAAMMAFVASSASAAIVNSKHDLSTTGPMGDVGQGTSEVCVFCHTPHGGGTQAPLWNRGNGPAVTVNYTSSSLNATPGAVAGDTGLCLSCHDGTTIAGTTLTNPPSDYLVSTGLTLSTNGNISTDLSNDHPVGFVFNATLVTADGGLNDPTALSLAQLFGTGSNEMWCSSCHDVHDTTNVPFLVASNAKSALCIDCHNK